MALASTVLYRVQRLYGGGDDNDDDDRRQKSINRKTPNQQ